MGEEKEEVRREQSVDLMATCKGEWFRLRTNPHRRGLPETRLVGVCKWSIVSSRKRDLADAKP